MLDLLLVYGGGGGGGGRKFHDVFSFYSTNWITKQLFGDINFYVANMKCSYEPFIYFHERSYRRVVDVPYFRAWNVKGPNSHQSSEEPFIFSNIVQLRAACQRSTYQCSMNVKNTCSGRV